MTTDLCAEDVVVHITNQEILSTEDATVSLESTELPGTEAPTDSAAAAAGTSGASSAMELGRRLLLAARAGATALVLDLMAKGAPFTSDWLGTSPLHLAASNAHVQTCGVLLRAGVSRDCRTKVERTPLHLAAHAGHAAVAALLLEHGAAADCRDMLRMTPLHWAAERGHTQVVRVLLTYGAEPRVVSKFHKTPAQLAAARGHTNIVTILEDALKQREAARSVRALVSERLAEEPAEPQQPTFATVQRIQDIKINKPKQTQEKLLKPEEKSEKMDENNENVTIEEGAAAQLLRRHGITLLPPDTGGTVLRALQSGRTCVLSDAGKLMLKESNPPSPPAPSRVVVRPASVRVLSLNNTRLGSGAGGGGGGAHKLLTKIVSSRDLQQQVKIVQLPADARFVSPRPADNKPRARPAAPCPSASPAAAPCPSAAPSPSRGPALAPRPPVKIIMNKSNFQRLLSGAARIDLTNNVHALEHPVQTEQILETSEQTMEDSEVVTLRSQLAASQRNVLRLTEELRQCKARLAQYEPQ